MATTYTAVTSGNWSDTVTTWGGVAYSGNDSYTTLLLHLNSDFNDNGVSAGQTGTHPATLSGSPPTINTSTYKFAAGSGYFLGSSSQQATYADSADWHFGSGNFTIDLWAKITSSQYAGILWSGYDDSNDDNFGILPYTDNHIYGYIYVGLTKYTATSPTISDYSIWHHIALVRYTSGGTDYIVTFLDGVPGTPTVVTGSVNTANYALYLGRCYAASALYYTGYIDEVRISKGIARWTSNFSASLPSQAYGGTSYPFQMATDDIVNIPNYTVTITGNAPQTGTGAVTVYNNGTLINAFNQTTGSYGAIVADLSTNGTVEFNANCVLRCQSIDLDTTGIVQKLSVTTAEKVLGQLNPSSGTTPTAVYTVPATKSTIVTTITICNSNASATTFRLSVMPSGTSDDPKNYLYWDYPIEGNITVRLDNLMLTLATGDVVNVCAGSANLSFAVFGSESPYYSNKVLGQSNPSATTLTAAYTINAPAISTVVSSMFICNRSATATTFRISVAVAGAGDANRQYLFYDYPLEGNMTVRLDNSRFTLAVTDVIRVYATLATLSFNIFGSERYT